MAEDLCRERGVPSIKVDTNFDNKPMLAKFDAGLAVAMSGTMNLTVGLTATYNSKPPAGMKSNDFGLFTGINVKFGATQ